MRILVIEDEHKIADSIKKGLEQEFYAVDVAYDGNKGFDLSGSEDYDLIILDRLLPGMDGIEIIRKIRSNQNHVPVLMLTARGQVQDKVEGLDAGADDYLAKPFAFDELLARIRAISRRPEKSLETVIVIGDLNVNSITHEIKRGGRQIKLSAKEYALLLYLVRNQNQVLSKNKIISHVWDYDADILPNTVEVYIGYLRNKIDKPFPEKPALIQTVRGFGYRLGKEE